MIQLLNPSLRAYSTLLVVVLGCTLSAQQLSVALTGSMHNGSSVPCFGMKDGTVVSVITGGTAPYTYRWSNGAISASITGVPAGYYSVEVKDVLGEIVKGEITLTEPEPLKVLPTVSSFANGHNISCFECNNGYIQLATSQGTPPYGYAWSDGPSTSQNRYSLGPKQYTVTVTDANGCQERAVVKITQPERSDWTMDGNAGTNPTTQFIGTSDNKDVVFKANGQESVRLKANGDISLLGTLSGEGPLYRSSDGTLRLGGPGGDVFPPLPPSLCANGLIGFPYWQIGGNMFTVPVCNEAQAIPKLGTKQAFPLHLITNDVTRMVITAEGKVAMGSTTTPGTKLHVQGDVSITNGTNGDLITSSSAETGPVLWARNNLAAWGLSIDPTGKGHILGDWNDPHPVMNFSYDQVEVPNLMLVGNGLLIGDVEARSGYRLFVQEGILTEKVKVAIKTTTDWSDHVFQPGYRLMSLEDVAAFVRINKHLPGVPSAQEMVVGGLDVAKTDAMLLEKIEEITLHMIEMKREL